MITLGKIDKGISDTALKGYIDRVIQITKFNTGDKLRGDKDKELVPFEQIADNEEMTVSDVQQFLHDADFCPNGQVDGICGYRTTAAIRLFQEYVRTVDGDQSIGSPDGALGNSSFKSIKEWKQAGRKADWSPPSGADNYQRGIKLLNSIKESCLAQPSKMLQRVNAFTGATDTFKVHEWNFDPKHIHLIGVRKNTRESEGKFNDIFFLLISGKVFTFFGSTDPGATENPAGAPFLTSGQHLYRFGWHKVSDVNRVYQALKPNKHGVLVVRSINDKVLTDDDLAGGLSANGTINVHWGGEGFNKIGKWSEGCQVITGKGYINHKGQMVDMAKYAASFYDKLGTYAGENYQSKGAYTVLSDIVASFSGDQDTVRYMLLTDHELAVSPEAVAMIDDARRQFSKVRWA